MKRIRIIFTQKLFTCTLQVRGERDLKCTFEANIKKYETETREMLKACVHTCTEGMHTSLQ